MCFSPYLGIGVGGQTGLVHNLLMQFFSLYCSKSEVFVFLIFESPKMTIQDIQSMF